VLIAQNLPFLLLCKGYLKPLSLIVWNTDFSPKHNTLQIGIRACPSRKKKNTSSCSSLRDPDTERKERPFERSKHRARRRKHSSCFLLRDPNTERKERNT